MSQSLQPGKLPHELLDRLIHTLPPNGAELIISPGVGRDAAGLQIGNQLVAITTDPITFAAKNISKYSVAVNVNDVACLGCRPKWYSGVLLLPLGTTEEELESIWQELVEELRKYHIQSIGGHVEVTPTVNQPVLVGQMVGEVIGDRLLNPENIKPGDKLLLWQKIGIEGVALIAREKKRLLQNHFSQEEIQQMQSLLDDPGICVWPFVEKLLPNEGVVALHDPTEGGIATAIHEVAEASGCGIHVNGDVLPFLPETLLLSNALKFNPLGLLASGSLLITCRAENEKELLAQFPEEPLVKIGEYTKGKRVILSHHGIHDRLPRFDRDEITRLLR